MKIVSIKMKNFLSHKERTIVGLNLINVITGENGAGKTAIRDAVSFALLGRAGGRKPVRYGEKSCEVEVALDNGVIINRKETASGSVKLDVRKGEVALEGSPSIMGAELLEQMGVSAEQVSAILETGSFMSYSPNIRKAILFRALAVEITKEALEEYLQGVDPSVDWTKAIEASGITDFNDDKGNAKSLVERRREIKARMSALSEMVDRYIDVPNHPENQTVEKAEEKLSELKAERDGLLETKGKIKAARVSQERLAVIKAKIKAAEAVSDPSAEIDVLESKINGLEAGNKALRADRDKLSAELSGYATSKAIVLSKIETLDGEAGNNCPTCERKITGSAKQKLLDGWKENIEALEDESAKVSKNVQDIDAALAENNSEIATAQGEIERLRAEANVDTSELEAERESLLKALNDIPQDSEVESDLAKVEERISKGETFVSELRRRDEADEKKAEVEEEVADLVIELEHVDAMARAYEPKGIKNVLLAKAIESFEDDLSGMSRQTRLGEIRISVSDKGLDVLVEGKDESQYSTGERLAVSMILQASLAYSSGLGFVFFDEVDRFVGDLSDEVNEVAFDIASQVGQVFLLVAKDSAPAEVRLETVSQLHLKRG